MACGVACVIVAWWEGELDRDKLQRGLDRDIDLSDIEVAVTTS
jgi:aerobic C4-dicarboxylate transport protein